MKITLIIIGILFVLIVLDTLQARIFKNSPFISWKVKLDNDSYVKKGILMDTYYCINEQSSVTVSWHKKNAKFSCPKNLIVINSIDDFYNMKLTKDKDIRNIDYNYSINDAINDNCYVYNNKNIYNQNLYFNFMNNYQNKKDAYIRVGKTTIEGNLILYDILYLASEEKLYLINDYTRDKFAKNNKEKIDFQIFNKMKEYEENWILYNNEKDIKNNKYMVISLIPTEDFMFYLSKLDVYNTIKFNEYLHYYKDTVYLAGNIDEFYIIDNGIKMTLKKYASTVFQTLRESIKNITDNMEQKEILRDGGTTIYKDKNKDITIITCNKINENNNIYIGDYSLIYEEDLCDN